LQVTSEYSTIYTDGSKDGDRVTSAAVFGQQVYSARLPSASAEANAIPLALKFVASSEKSKFMICSDSLSHYLTNNYAQVYYDLYDIWSRLPALSDFDR
jgi:hypothetical protein